MGKIYEMDGQRFMFVKNKDGRGRVMLKVGSRRDVFNGVADITEDGHTKDELMVNQQGRYVLKSRSASARRAAQGRPRRRGKWAKSRRTAKSSIPIRLPPPEVENID